MSIGGRADTECVRAETGTADSLSLANTAWRLVGFEGGDGTRLTPDDPSKYTIEFDADSNLAVRFDCNRGRGAWKASGSSLEFGPLALTRAMCPPGSLHDHLVKQWPYIRSWLIRDGHLHLSLMADGGIYEFEPGATLEGTATFRERMALPPEARFEARLEDVSRADAPAEVIGEVSLAQPGNPPFRFAIPFDPARIQANHSYAVRGSILLGEQLLFTTDQAYPVLTGGHPHSVALLLRRAASATTVPDATVENTYWKLVAMGTTPARIGDNIPEPHLLLHPADTRASGSTGCNGFSGSYQLSGDSLRFGNLLSTLRACVDPELNRQERAFLDALGATRTLRITGDTLALSGGAGLLARFTAQYMR